MAQMVRCPLTGVACTRVIMPEEKAFFVAEPADPEDDRRQRAQAIEMAVQDAYRIRSALDEKEVHAFTCKICEMIQSCPYGIADITGENPNVILELGMMMALGKPVVILRRKEKKEELKLPSDLSAIEVIPFVEYIDIVEPFKDVMAKLTPPVPAPSPMDEVAEAVKQLTPGLIGQLEDIKKALDEQGQRIVGEFQRGIEEAKLDAITSREAEKVEIPSQLEQRLQRLEQSLKELGRIGFTTDARTAFLRGNFYHNKGDFEAALDQYTWSLSFKPDHPDTLYNRGNTYHRLERYDEALADFNRSLELRTDGPATLNNRGITYRHLGRYEEALADYNRSLELRPDDPDTLTNRGVTYDNLGRYEEALADYNRSLELRHDHPDTLMNRGAAYDRLGRYEDALADYNRSLELRPDDPDTLNNRGATFGILGRYEEALADYNRSLEMRPDQLTALYNLACLFSLWKKPDDALVYLEQAIAGDEKNREDAKTDKDFDNIQDDPRFKKLVGLE